MVVIFMGGLGCWVLSRRLALHAVVLPIPLHEPGDAGAHRRAGEEPGPARERILQNASVDNMTDFSFTVNRSEYAKAMDVLNKQVKGHINASDIRGDAKVCKVSLVG